MRRDELKILIVLMLIANWTAACYADDKAVKFETDPPGAQVEVNGSVACTTPCSIPVPGYYFGFKFTAFSKHGKTPINIRLLKEGCATKAFAITRGPLKFTNGFQMDLYTYYLISSREYHVQLYAPEDASTADTAPSPPREQGTTSCSGLTAKATEANVKVEAMAAVVTVSAPDRSGSGFFVSADGLVMTSSDVVGNHRSVTIILADGNKIESSRVYMDTHHGLAVTRIPGDHYSYLKLSKSALETGADVFELGAPGAGSTTGAGTRTEPSAETKSMVTMVYNVHSGVWIQTETALDRDNIGGPVLNQNGEVVGVNTLKDSNPLTGLNVSAASPEIQRLVRLRYGVDLHGLDVK